MRCPSCDHDNRAERRFCAECGAALAAVCAVVWRGEPSPARSSAAAAANGSRPRRQRPRAPTPTPEPEAALPAGERRQLTVLFCDLVGSTPLSQQLDAEEWRDLIAQYQQAAAGAVVRFGGHVAKNLGDGLLIYFGWPTAREDDPERAVRAGLAIVDAMAPLNATLAAGDGTRLAVRIGMHTGPVVIADGGEVFGETANVAARVQGAAEPDTVVITAATQRLVAGMFVVEDRGPQTLKGVREPVTLYRVVQPSGVRSRLDVAAGRLTRFVGREVELATLVDRWERAQDGEGQNVVVLGEAGVGKSRLVYQLHEHLAAVPHTWLECGATPYTEGTPFHPIIALVAQGLAFAPEDTAAEKLGKLEVGLGALASAETVALLADFLGLPPPTRLQLSPELQRRKTIDLLAQWNLRLSAVQPLVVFVEDLHWCDASTLELLGHLIAQSPTARVLLLATARPEFTPPWPARSNLTTVQLARLTKRQARDMIAALAGTELPAATLDALVARADGVPLYVEELTKAVVEPGAARGVEAIPATPRRLADGAARSALGGEGGGAAGGGAGTGVRVSAAGGDGGHGRGRAAPGARAPGRRGDPLRARRAARGHVHLQARADPGDGVPVAAQAHAPAAARARRPGAGGTLPRARRGRARGDRAALRPGGAGRASDRALPAGRRARRRSGRRTRRPSAICGAPSRSSRRCRRRASAISGSSGCRWRSGRRSARPGDGRIRSTSET